MTLLLFWSLTLYLLSIVIYFQEVENYCVSSVILFYSTIYQYKYSQYLQKMVVKQ